ncbi:MAG TPA: hypothetical protein VJ725_07325 [Thermoanaerobaculia bacterium]|nr:hypothetical protein [Thermoanaerobaculia bacterium]
MIAALYVLPDGPYAGREDVDLWPEDRDARLYAGPWPVVAHPPCERWGRYWNGGPSSRVRKELGADGGCFEAALQAVRTWGGVLEHPEGSHAWRRHGLVLPPRRGGWIAADILGGWTCCVEQGHYGHAARKATWLYAWGIPGTTLPELAWGPFDSPSASCDGGKAKFLASGRRASRTGIVQCLSKRKRTLTPPGFADLLLGIARLAERKAS